MSSDCKEGSDPSDNIVVYIFSFVFPILLILAFSLCIICFILQINFAFLQPLSWLSHSVCFFWPPFILYSSSVSVFLSSHSLISFLEIMCSFFHMYFSFIFLRVVSVYIIFKLFALPSFTILFTIIFFFESITVCPIIRPSVNIVFATTGPVLIKRHLKYSNISIFTVYMDQINSWRKTVDYRHLLHRWETLSHYDPLVSLTDWSMWLLLRRCPTSIDVI